VSHRLSWSLWVADGLSHCLTLSLHSPKLIFMKIRSADWHGACSSQCVSCWVAAPVAKQRNFSAWPQREPRNVSLPVDVVYYLEYCRDILQSLSYISSYNTSEEHCFLRYAPCRLVHTCQRAASYILKVRPVNCYQNIGAYVQDCTALYPLRRTVNKLCEGIE
jgi:hypothetical protein